MKKKTNSKRRVAMTLPPKKKMGRPKQASGGLAVGVALRVTQPMWDEILTAVGGNPNEIHAWIRGLIDARLEAEKRARPGIQRYLAVAVPEAVYPFLKGAAIQAGGASDGAFILACVESELERIKQAVCGNPGCVVSGDPPKPER